MSEAAYRRLIERNRERVAGTKGEQPRQEYRKTSEPPRYEPRQGGVSTDDLSLADAYAQLALAIRRGDAARAAELQDHIDSLLERMKNQEAEWRNKR
jgi:hypothetical protein